MIRIAFIIKGHLLLIDQVVGLLGLTCYDDSNGELDDPVNFGGRDGDVVPALLLRVEGHGAAVRQGPVLVFVISVALLVPGMKNKAAGT